MVAQVQSITDINLKKGFSLFKDLGEIYPSSKIHCNNESKECDKECIFLKKHVVLMEIKNLLVKKPN